MGKTAGEVRKQSLFFIESVMALILQADGIPHGRMVRAQRRKLVRRLNAAIDVTEAQAEELMSSLTMVADPVTAALEMAETNSQGSQSSAEIVSTEEELEEPKEDKEEAEADGVAKDACTTMQEDGARQMLEGEEQEVEREDDGESLSVNSTRGQANTTENGSKAELEQRIQFLVRLLMQERQKTRMFKRRL